MKTALTILFIIVCIAMVCLVVAQEGKEAGLGTISGMAETYWSKNKSQSLQGKLLRATTICCVLFFVVAIALSLAM